MAMRTLKSEKNIHNQSENTFLGPEYSDFTIVFDW